MNTTAARRALILTPQGRDAAVAEELLRGAGIAALLCTDLAAFEQALDEDTCFAIVAEEALRQADLRGIAATLAAQPAWSDLPFIVLTRRESASPREASAERLAELFGNVSFLERPFHPRTFVSVARTALKGRQRQYEARARIEELRESEQQLRTALLAGRLGSWQIDLATMALSASATCKALFGRGPDDALSFADLIRCIHPEDRRRVEDAIRGELAPDADLAMEFRVAWPDGSIRWADIRARLVRDGHGGRGRLVGVSSDITERKDADGQLRRSNETLEERVAERTAELERAHAAMLTQIAHRERAEEQLRQAQKMEMIGQLTGGVAHDFNNLLMAVLSNLDLLRRHVAGNPDGERLIDIASQGAQRGAALTQRLLAFARRQDLQLVPTNLVDLVRGMTDLLARSIGDAVELRLDLPIRSPPVMVDVNQIELALLNLVVNARDAMPEGGTLRIRIDSAKATGDGDLPAGQYTRLVVIDSGHGMDAETLKKATEPFFTTKELGKGTGLGLSMIHGLAIQLRGALRLTSEVGRGTRAELWLPIAAAADQPEAEAPEAAAPPPPAAAPAAAEKHRILVVDDDPLIAMTTAMMLSHLGHEVLEASSGKQALEILQREDGVDLLITDYSMPKMTGAQLAEAARAMHPDLPVLLATGYAELPAGEKIDLPRLGKPYRREQLDAEIRKLLAGGSA
ncbi:response regulator [Roseomonas hellenica]|uniref:histidine kinase n=1 Tax=Plastoroseomonas hellenica TaxID=2687306 RepID=A0ABS5F7Z5_9PROT|nr:response regulator [Plastoroseomonas hellenica]